MKKDHIAAILVALALLIGVSFYAHISRGQSQSQKSDSKVKPTIAVTSAKPAASDLKTAAARNATLQNDLDWIFGGKHRRGWSLYNSLIAQTLDTRKGPASTDFAKAVSVWQKRSGLNPTGVLDEEPFYAMVAEWQNNRLKDRTPARPEQLITAPISDFYDPERLPELRQVERNTYAAYKQMVAAAIADSSLHLGHANRTELTAAEKYFKIISAFRSREYQDKLRRESPNSGSAGLAVNSPHFTGRALDVYVGGDPVDTRDSNRAIQVNTPLYKWLVKNAGRFGFRPYFYEPWHWEYVK
ncbi:MAG: zinc D-Ala-D-Ala carboxypeptidase [Blastocatellia bacterium]|nr:zinc D-Ala-D-Ala carboxypeptidase [Blastocatellia bacterium]